MKPQIRLLTCKRCGCSIEAGLCGYECAYDATLASDRDPDSMEIRVFELINTEPLPAPPSDRQER